MSKIRQREQPVLFLPKALHIYLNFCTSAEERKLYFNSKASKTSHQNPGKNEQRQNPNKKHIICVVPRNFFLLKSFSKYFGSASGGFLHAGTRFVKFNLLNSFPFNSNGGILNMISVMLDSHTFTSLHRKFEARKVRDGETLYSTGVLTTLGHSFFG